jgi:hypothetical protein
MSLRAIKLSSGNFSFSRTIISLLVLFLLVFPKGGIKIGPVPITWGYVLLALTSFFLILRGRFLLTRERTLVLFSLLPFQAITLGSFFINGAGYASTVIAFITTFFALPWIFLGILSSAMERVNFDLLFSMMRRGIFFVAVFGIFLFLYKTVTGNFISIPFLTTNYHDIDTFETTKSIARGELFKLISTYQNGNIYGLCILMLLPLYAFIEPSPFKKYIVILSLLLTLARTVWIGLFLYILLEKFYNNRVTAKSILLFAFQSTLFLLILELILFALNHDIFFLFDATLGGRVGQMDVLSEWTLFPSKEFDLVFEIVYLSMLKDFGLIGLLTFVLAITSPLILYKFSFAGSSPIKKSISAGLFIYLILCCSDGAILYIPVMAFFWFLSSLLLAKQNLLPSSLPNHLTTS